MVEDCEPEVVDIVVNYMHGIEIPNQVLTVIEVSRVSDFALTGVVLPSLVSNSRRRRNVPYVRPQETCGRPSC